MTHRVYLGVDSRELRAYELARASLLDLALDDVLITPLHLERLEAARLMRRPTKRTHAGFWDEISDAPMSTEFAISRFLTPILAQTGFALFADSDIVVMRDIGALFELADPSLALQVVPHHHVGGLGEKMDGARQTYYARKNWSSVMLFNCDHPANRRLTLDLVNTLPGRDLHRFSWLEDQDLGTLPPEWNWLVGVEPRPLSPAIAHYTLGGPWLPNWRGGDFDSEWLDAEKDHRAGG